MTPSIHPGRCVTSLLLVAALAAPSPADDLFVASSNSLFARGNPMSGGFQNIGACLGVPQAMAIDGGNLFLGDASGRIYRVDLATSGVTIFADSQTSTRTMVVLGNELLVGGTTGTSGTAATIERFSKATGASLGAWQIQGGGEVTAMRVSGNHLYAGFASGLIADMNANGEMSGFLGICAGAVACVVADATHLVVGTSSGFVYRMDRENGNLDGFFDTGHAITSGVLQGGSLLTAGPDGVVRRFNRVTGVPQGTLVWNFDVISMDLAISSVGTGSCYGYDCPCANADQISGCRNSTGVGSFLGGSGSASVTADDLTLTVTNMPSNSMGRLYMGAGTMSMPFGDGLLCAGSGGYGQHRFPVQSVSTNGVFEFGPGIVQFSHDHFTPSGGIQPGFTWHFQAWYRNSAGPCGSGFNTTNAFSVTFAP